MIKNIAVIFDMDGVLVDNSVYHQRAFKEYFDRIGGREFTPDMFGRSNEDILKLMFPGISGEKIEEYTEGKEAYYRKIFKPHMQPLKGLLDLLKTFKANNIKMAVGSSAPTVNVDFVLDGLDIRHYFDQVVDSSGVAKAKPAPDIYLKAAKLLGVEPVNCVVFEDAIAGIEAARQAGMKVVSVATTLSFDDLACTDDQIHDFSLVDIDFIYKLFVN
ncbi:MAG: HAD family phosphatase [Prevotellaceae bacterium]|jgi:beta-phosphoglucomutase family hydrolase|nr:HAD family phosphatase [Prevotellaceae bacterium]